MRTLRRYQCSNGHRFNMAGIIETIRQRNAVTGDVTSSWRERHDWPTACVTCGSTSIRRNGKDIAVTAGSASCGQKCEHATASKCSCVCGGMSHGIAN